MHDIVSTSGRLHGEFIRLLFLQTHRETDRLKLTVYSFRSSVSGIHQWTIPPPPRGVLGHPENKSRWYPRQDGCFTYYTQYWWGTYHFKNPYSPITLAKFSSINLVSIFRCSSSPRNPVYVRLVDFSDFVFSLSSHRHSYIGLVFISRFLDS